MSQEKLGERLGLTFQQIQKYEKGANRIGASRLLEIARLLEAPVQFFFDGAPGTDATDETPYGAFSEPDGVGFNCSADAADANRFVSTPEGLQLVEAFSRIKRRDVRWRLIELACTLADAEEDRDRAQPARGIYKSATQ